MSPTKAAELAAHVRAVVAAAPPLNDEQLNTIVSILAPTLNPTKKKTRAAVVKHAEPPRSESAAA